MNRQELATAIGSYRTGLETELTLLGQLQELADAQRAASVDNDLPRLAAIADERLQAMASLLAVEHQIKPVRQALASSLKDAVAHPGFEELLALHRTASHLVATILSSDQETMQALRDAEVARRFAAQVIERGETTLAAYRRVIAPPVPSASIVDRRG